MLFYFSSEFSLIYMWHGKPQLGKKEATLLSDLNFISKCHKACKCSQDHLLVEHWPQINIQLAMHIIITWLLANVVSWWTTLMSLSAKAVEADGWALIQGIIKLQPDCSIRHTWISYHQSFQECNAQDWRDTTMQKKQRYEQNNPMYI
jgi:hypothetical protein